MAADPARIEELARELLQISRNTNSTLFLAAGGAGSSEAEAILVVSTDPQKASQIRLAFEAVAAGWDTIVQVVAPQDPARPGSLGGEGRRPGLN